MILRNHSVLLRGVYYKDGAFITQWRHDDRRINWLSAHHGVNFWIAFR